MGKKSEDQLSLPSTSCATISTTDQQQQQGVLETTSLRDVKYKGVRKRKWGKWVSEIRLPNSRERIWLGSYDSPEKAARAFDAAQFCLRGPTANFNFPDNPPDIPGGQTMGPAEIQAAAAEFAHAPFRNVPPTRRVEEVEEEEEDYSPTLSDMQMEGDVAAGGETASFGNQMGGLNGGFGSGNFGNEFGMYTGYDEFTAGEYYSSQQTANFDYAAGAGDHDNYDASIYLWNF